MNPLNTSLTRTNSPTHRGKRDSSMPQVIPPLPCCALFHMETKKLYVPDLTKYITRVKKLEYKMKSGKERRKEKIVLSDDKEIAEDSFKQGRKIS
ncbi:hypothetical protein Tco_0156652 [Tanacetum coccineum]